ncbi:MAG: DUF58 domain-containing protein [Candidatus Cloacimonetes bacterium]|nr:DUF58 domain-containing protein [Candidatus Cloacimonadota bacterium]
MPVISDELIARIEKYHLKTRSIVEGFMVGLHKSPYHGFSVEFADHRQYIPGDPVRNVDWKLYAKTDRFYLKRYEEETNVRCYLLVDHSLSMSYGSGGTTKFDYARQLAAALSYLIMNQKDAVGLITFADEITNHLPPKAFNGYLNVIFDILLSIEPISTTNTLNALHAAAESLKKRSLIILLTDLLDEPEKLIAGLKHFRFNHHEVLVFHIIDKEEQEFNFRSETQFIDSETKKHVTVNPWQIRNDYRSEFKKYADSIKEECFRSGIEYNPIDTSVPIEDNLLRYLHKRSLY